MKNLLFGLLAYFQWLYISMLLVLGLQPRPLEQNWALDQFLSLNFFLSKLWVSSTFIWMRYFISQLHRLWSPLLLLFWSLFALTQSTATSWTLCSTSELLHSISPWVDHQAPWLPHHLHTCSTHWQHDQPWAPCLSLFNRGFSIPPIPTHSLACMDFLAYYFNHTVIKTLISTNPLIFSVSLANSRFHQSLMIHYDLLYFLSCKVPEKSCIALLTVHDRSLQPASGEASGILPLLFPLYHLLIS